MPRYPAFYVDTPVLCESRAIHAFKQAIHHCHLNILNSSWCFCMSCYWQAGEQKLSVLMENTQIRQERVFVIKNSFTTTIIKLSSYYMVKGRAWPHLHIESQQWILVIWCSLACFWNTTVLCVNIVVLPVAYILTGCHVVHKHELLKCLPLLSLHCSLITLVLTEDYMTNQEGWLKKNSY